MHTIEIISDVSCPWCAIGYRALRAAITQLDLSDSTEIAWKSFELNPDMVPEGQDRSQYMQQKYGLNSKQVKTKLKHLVDRGLEDGYEFNFSDDSRVYNTFDAHRLIQWAKAYGLQTELKSALFDFYFKRNGDLSNAVGLLTCVAEVGLPTDDAQQLLGSNDFAYEVKSERYANSQKGISSVPAFIFNSKYLISGGQPKESFVNVLQELERERQQALLNKI